MLKKKIEFFNGRLFLDIERGAWGRGGVVVNALDLRSEGQWLEAQPLPSCFLRQESLLHFVSLHPGV